MQGSRLLRNNCILRHRDDWDFAGLFHSPLGRQQPFGDVRQQYINWEFVQIVL